MTTTLLAGPLRQARQRLSHAGQGKTTCMGRIWGPGRWLGPGSRLENRTYLRWFRFLLHFLLGTLVFFLLNYFGWIDRTEHELVPSLLRAMFNGVFLGVGMTAYYEWMDRRAERE